MIITNNVYAFSYISFIKSGWFYKKLQGKLWGIFQWYQLLLAHWSDGKCPFFECKNDYFFYQIWILPNYEHCGKKNERRSLNLCWSFTNRTYPEITFKKLVEVMGTFSEMGIPNTFAVHSIKEENNENWQCCYLHGRIEIEGIFLINFVFVLKCTYSSLIHFFIYL